MSSSASFQASQLFSATGLNGATIGVVVRSSFGNSLWASVISLDGGSSMQVVSPFRSFLASDFLLRYRDIAVTLDDSSIKDVAGLAVLLGVSDIPLVLYVVLEGVEDSAGGAGFLVRAHACKPSLSLCLGSQDHYARLKISRFPLAADLDVMLGSTSMKRQLGEQLYRLGKSISPEASFPQLVREFVIAATLVTGLTASAKLVGSLPGPSTAGLQTSLKEQLADVGCLPRLLPLIWLASKLGYLGIWQFLASSTTSVGSELLDWLREFTSASQDSWARDLRKVRSGAYSGEARVLPSMVSLLPRGISLEQHGHLISQACEVHGGAVLDAHVKVSAWLASCDNLDPVFAGQVVTVFATPLPSKLVLDDGAIYLGGDSSSTASSAFKSLVAPSDVDKTQYNFLAQVFGYNREELKA